MISFSSGLMVKDLNNFTPNLSSTHKASKNCFSFLDLNVKLIDGKLETDFYMKPTDTISTFITCPLIPNTLSTLLFTVKLYTSIGYALKRRILTTIN